ncbi:MAG: tetratricopeptide repeat protein [Actinomycetota bacterium]
MNPFIKEIIALMQQDKEQQVIAQVEQNQYHINKDVLKLLGCAYIRVGSYEKALYTFKIFFEYPHEKHEAAFVWMNIATIMRFQGQPLKGVKITERIIEDYPENPVYWAELANCHFEAGQDEEAKQCYNTARKHIKNTTELNKAAIYSDIGLFYKEKGEMYGAVFYLNISLYFNPTSKTNLLYLGDAFSEANNNRCAKKAYLKAKNYYPEDQHIQDYVRIKLEDLGAD